METKIITIDISKLSNKQIFDLKNAIVTTLNKSYYDINEDLHCFWSDVDDNSKAKQEMENWSKAALEQRINILRQFNNID